MGRGGAKVERGLYEKLIFVLAWTERKKLSCLGEAEYDLYGESLHSAEDDP